MEKLIQFYRLTVTILLTITITGYAWAQVPEPPHQIGDIINDNGSFTEFDLGVITDLDNWTLNNNEGANAQYEVVSGAQDGDSRALKVDIGTFNNGSDWNVEAVNEPFYVQEGDQITATVWVKADTDSRIARLYFGQPESGNFTRHEVVEFALGTDWTKLELSHTAGAADEEHGMRFGILLNFSENDGAVIHIDNTQIVKQAPSWSFEDLDTGSDPNPFHVVNEAQWNYGGTAEVSTERAQDGSQSVKMQGASDQHQMNLRNSFQIENYLEPGGKITFEMWISSEDLSYISSITPHIQHGSDWQGWTGITYDQDDITPDAWNTLEVVVPEPLDGEFKYFGLEVATYLQYESEMPTVFIDNVIYHSVVDNNGEFVFTANEADSLALVDLYNNTNGNNWNRNDHWLTDNVYSWEGVKELDANGQISWLDLSDNNMDGELPSSFSDLTALSVINFNNNSKLTGEIFSLIVGFDDLLQIEGNDCDFYGEIPSGIGNHTNLNYIAMWENRLEGELPSEIGNLTSLTELRLEGNNFTGNIPSEMGDLSNLYRLNLNINSFTGQIPSTLGNLANLEILSLWGNSLTGGIPEELGNLAALTDLELFQNDLTGSIPPELGNLTQLWRLDLHSNQLSGSIPSELGNLNNLEVLDLSSNSFSGQIPSELGNLSALVELILWDNQFTGGIPESLGDITSLIELNIGNPGLGGSIPASLGQLENLEYLRLNSADLTGSIPPELGNLSNLQSLYLYDNDLSGTIPVELANLMELRLLYLFSNENLSGALPPELGNLSKLERLSINGTSVSGAIPDEWGQLRNLEFLRLEENDLSGSLPEGFSGLTNLETFYINDTEVVLPTSNRVKGWIAGIDDFRSSGHVNLPAPTPVQPGNADAGQPVPTMFSWEGAEKADHYVFEIYSDAALQDTIGIVAGHPDSWLSIDTLEHNTTYHWRVAGGVEFGLSAWSDTLHFKTMLDSEAGPALLTPDSDADSVEIPIQFTWEEFEGAATYYLEISTVPSFDTTTTVKELSGTEFTYEDARDETDYFWRVRAEAGGAPGGWSSTGMFTTELRVPEVPEWSPEDGAEDVESNVVLQWSPAKRAETYNLQIAADDAFGSLINDETGIDTTAFTASLKGETTYYWRVQAVNSSGAGNWSEPGSFTTETSTAIDEKGSVPDKFNLSQNYPNPFNPTTQIRYDLPEASDVTITVFDMLGREIATLVDEKRSAGSYTVQFDAGKLSSGIYLYRMGAGSFVKVQSMTLIK